jgi:hypothetical protein
MKSVSALLLVVVFGMCGCQDRQVSTLEKRITDLEIKVKALEEKQKERADEASVKEAEFKDCVENADRDYMQDVRSNGTKNANGSYAVDLRVEQQLAPKGEEVGGVQVAL